MTPLSVAQAAEEHPDRLALVGDGPPLTYRQLADAVGQRRLPEGPIVLTPSPGRQGICDVLAALETGRPLALLHPRWTDTEKAAATARFLAHGQPGEVVVYTSGSSGRPKGVRLPQTSLRAAADAHSSAMPFVHDDRWLLTLPLAHVGGLSVITRCLTARACVVLAPGRFDADHTIAALHAGRATLLSVVPTMMDRLLSKGSPPSTLRAVLLGGAAASPALIRDARDAGWPVLPTYGASETCGQVCTQRLDDPRPDGVGPALPTIDVRITRDGDIEVAGPTLMAGYLDDPTPIVEGWFRTGDCGQLDEEGHLRVLGRRDAVLITGGENVDPVEVEMALESHPSVERAFVTGLPDRQWGQRIVAVVVGDPPPLDTLRRHLARDLAGYKHPRAMARVDALPNLPNGKLDRIRAHERAEQLLLTRA